MSKYGLTPVPESERALMPFFFDDPTSNNLIVSLTDNGTPPTESYYKIYNDGSHYIATRCTHSPSKPKTHKTEVEDIDILFDSLYNNAVQDGLQGDEMTAYIKLGILKLFVYYEGLDGYIADKIKKKLHNLYARKKRFRRKAYINKWNYFVTITYDDKKQDSDTFKKKLRTCLSHLHTRRGWRYMGVFERAPETGRLHFHGLVYVPDGEMIGTLMEKTDYSTAQHAMQTIHSNDFFYKAFGRNDFERLNAMELKRGNSIQYLLKYIGKSGEKIVYSRGIPTEIVRKVNDNDIITEMQDFVTKYILFDDVISWERDVMHFKRKQLSMIDLICNPPKSA